jgi:alpha-tubulin suppressor-like RCC1 family protein
MRPIRSLTLPLLALLVAATACSDEQPTNPQVDPVAAFTVSDGANGGNPHFFFLNPLVPAPNPGGIFDATAEPEVEICPLDATESCLAAIAIFTTEAGDGSETIRVSTDDEHYVVNWHSGDFDLDTGVTYRIRVLLEGRELGYGDVDVVSTGKELKNVATGEFIALKDGRTLPIKFRIEEGAVAAVQPADLAVGYDHTCALDENGAALCWGANDYGQLGTGNQIASTTPVAVAGGLTFESIAIGQYTTCAVTAAGDGYCWGYNQWGQVGTGTAGGIVTQPTLVTGGQSWQVLAPAFEFTCGLDASGTAWCWGNNGRGTLGRGFFSAQEPTPAPVIGGLTFTSLSAFRASACALEASGAAFCWGGNGWGNLGDGTVVNRADPTTVVGGLTFADLQNGTAHACGVTTDGDGYCWGRNNFGELGTGAPFAGNLPTPQLVTGGHDFASIRPGFAHTCAVTTTDDGLCWGNNTFGQLGLGQFTGIQPSPQPVLGAIDWSVIDAGYTTTCGRSTGDDLYCWGRNLTGAVGDGSTADRYSPVLVHEGPAASPPICGNFLEFNGGIAGLPDGWTHEIIDFAPLVGATPLAGGQLNGQRTNSGERVRIQSGLSATNATTFEWDGAFMGSPSGQQVTISLWDSSGVNFYTVLVGSSDILYPRNPNPTLILRVDLPGPVIVQENTFTFVPTGVWGEASFTPAGVQLTTRDVAGQVIGSAFLAEPIDYGRIDSVTFGVYETDGDGVTARRLAVNCLQ